MKQFTAEQTKVVATTVGGVGATWFTSLENINLLVTIFVGGATFVWMCFQSYLAYKRAKAIDRIGKDTPTLPTEG